MGRYLPLKQFSWPQDALHTPPGFEDMPPVSRGNAVLSKGEPFVYGIQINTLAPAVPSSPTVTMGFITIQPDADFWCDQILVDATDSPATQLLTLGSSAHIQIEDTRNGYRLGHSNSQGMGADMFSNQTTTNLSGGGGQAVAPPVVRMNGTLLTPYCFTRNNAIKITVQRANVFGGIVQSYFFAFMGWKEYEFASR